MPNQKFTPTLSIEEIRQHESNNDININRRMTMLVLTKSYDELAQLATDDEAVFLQLFETAASYTNYLQSALDLSKDVLARMKIVADRLEG
ncbi:hypothetical protein [Acinetobacter towneri]|uniref:hypothetical protein n=1 Tax=Acinetobacter towneri TaxID=202956 RepID=UPI001F6210EB|nr:hypothetical protein [Acinetobacter towneri]UNT63908.1 hypothetical protein IHE37_09490 [Acinetobacter towneri]